MMSHGSIPEIYFAGFSYLGDSQYISSSYPFTSAINRKIDGAYYLDRHSLASLKSVRPEFFVMNISELANIDNENQLTMTLAISSETSSVERIGEKYKLWLQVIAQVFVFDFKKMKIVANHPIVVTYSEIYSESPTDVVIEDAFRANFYSENNNGVFSEFARIAATLKPINSLRNTMQVENVFIDEAVRNQLSNSVSERMFAQKTGEMFTQFLSANQKIIMLPFVKGHAIGNKLAGKFSDGKSYMVELPEADFLIDINVTHFVKKLHDSALSGDSWVYAARSHFKFYEPLSKNIIFEESLFNGSTKVVPKSQSIVDDWPAYQETLFVLFDKFTKQISSPNRQWLETHAKSAHKYKDLLKLKEVVDSCR